MDEILPYKEKPINLEGKSYVLRIESQKYTDENQAIVNYYQFPYQEKIIEETYVNYKEVHVR